MPLILISEVDISPRNLDSSLCFIQPGILHDVLCEIYSYNKQGDNIKPWCIPFPIWNQSVVPCLVLTVASWTCLHISQEAGKVVWYSHLLEDFPVCCDPHKGFDIVNKAEVDVFLEFSRFFYDPMDINNLISSSLPFPNPAWTSGSSQVTNCWSVVWRILSITLLVWEMSAPVW